MIKELNELNKITVKTWKWLKVNDLSLKEVNIPEKLSYDNQPILNEENNEYLTDIDNSEVKRIISSFNIDNNKESNEITELNEKNCNSKYCIYIKENEKVVEPIVFNYTLDNDNIALIDNITIVAGKGSESTIVIKYNSNIEDYTFHNGILKIYADDDSKVNLIKVQMLNDKSYNFDSNVTYLGYNTKLDTTLIDLGAKVSVQNQYNDLLRENATATLKNIYFGSNDSLNDMNYVMNHIGRRTNSLIEVKGALKDNAKKTFRGTIDFKTGAFKSQGEESEHVILLSDSVKTDSIPLLLCGEDDVSGAHAASVGKINEEKLFYLMSRGFNEKEAKKVIIEGEFSNIINNIPDENIREEVIQEIKRRLENE